LHRTDHIREGGALGGKSSLRVSGVAISEILANLPRSLQYRCGQPPTKRFLLGCEFRSQPSRALTASQKPDENPEECPNEHPSNNEADFHSSILSISF
jgi:hypothetical protein